MDIRRVYTFTFFFLYSVVSFAAAEVVPGEFIVRYKNQKVSSKALGKTSLQHNLSLKKSWKRINTHHFRARQGADEAELLKNLKNDPDVLFAEPNYYVKSQDIPYFQTGGLIKAPESWVEGAPAGSGTVPVVAILDSGVDINHAMFNGTGRLWENDLEKNGLPGVDDDGNGHIDDINGWNFLNNNNILTDNSGHGTHVAGIAIGATEDIQLITPAVPTKIKVMVLKFLDANGVGKTSDAINAIYYAVDQGAKVLNNSWGGEGYSSSLHEAIAYSFFKNTLFVAAAGNNESDNDQTPIFPANYDVPNVISVGASNDTDGIAFFSNFGSSTVDVSAPGVNIISAAPGGGYYSSTGTSMSSPFVAGLGAFLTREAPHFSGYQLKRDILASAEVSSGLSYASVTQSRVNFFSAVQLVKANSSEATFSPDYTPEYLFSASNASSVKEDGGFGCGRVESLNENSLYSEIGPQEKVVIVICLLPLILFSLVRIRILRKSKQFIVD